MKNPQFFVCFHFHFIFIFYFFNTKNKNSLVFHILSFRVISKTQNWKSGTWTGFDFMYLLFLLFVTRKWSVCGQSGFNTVRAADPNSSIILSVSEDFFSCKLLKIQYFLPQSLLTALPQSDILLPVLNSLLLTAARCEHNRDDGCLNASYLSLLDSALYYFQQFIISVVHTEHV